MKKFVGMIIVVIGILSLFNVYNDELKVILPITVDENIYNNLIKISNLLTSAGAVGFVLFIIRLASVADSTNRERDIELKNLLWNTLNNQKLQLELFKEQTENILMLKSSLSKDTKIALKTSIEKTEDALKGLKEFARLTITEKLESLKWQIEEFTRLSNTAKTMEQRLEFQKKLKIAEAIYQKLLGKAGSENG